MSKASKALNVLLIDDDEDEHEVLSIALREIDPTIVCHWAKDGETGLHTLQTESTLPHYVFLDINMPKLSGYEVLERITHNPKLKNVPVIIYSTSGEENTISKSMQLGAYSYLQKATSIKALKKELLSIFDGQHPTKKGN